MMSYTQLQETIAAYSEQEIKFLKRRFDVHRNKAKKRNIGFKLCFQSWLFQWTLSEKIQPGFITENGIDYTKYKRGTSKTFYVMSRFEDSGDYEVGNIHIQLHSENVSEALYRRHNSNI